MSGNQVQNDVAVIGGGVVGCAVAHALARRGVSATVLEAEPALALGASGTNSGILHTGFDSTPGQLETELILRGAELRDELAGELGVRLVRCGAELRPRDDPQRRAVAALAQNARTNGVRARLLDGGSLDVPGEAITDPVAFTYALADAACAGGARVRTGTLVTTVSQRRRGRLALGLDGAGELPFAAAVNCAGLFADEVAALAGERPFTIRPRKGEFLVFEQSDPPLEQILLPVPSALGKGVLVFPTVDGHLIAGPTARERTDKRDWSVEEDAVALIGARAQELHPPLRDREPVAAYAGLRPAGVGANYAIELSTSLSGLLHIGAIRSTGLSASLAIGELAVEILAGAGAIAPGAPRVLPTPPARPEVRPWWRRAAAYRASMADV